MSHFEKLKGIFPPLITPLDKDGRVEEKPFRKIIRRALDAGANGLVILGTTGEGPVLEKGERYRAIEISVDEAGSDVPILAGTGDVNTNAVKENNRKVAELGAYGAILIPPFYFPQSQAAMIDFYKGIAGEGSLPIVIYHFPQISKITLTPETVGILSEDENIVGIKDSSANFINFQAFLNYQTDSFVVYQGVGALSCASLMMKAGGFISPVANVDPHIEVEMYKAVQEGNFERAKELQKKVTNLIGLWRGYNGPIPSVLKALLSIDGVCDTWPCSPNPVIQGDELVLLKEKYRKIIG